MQLMELNVPMVLALNMMDEIRANDNVHLATIEKVEDEYYILYDNRYWYEVSSSGIL